MILSDMVDFICGKVNQTEAEDKEACKGFLTQQHETLWHSQLWKDSLIGYTQTINPGATYSPNATYLPSKGVLLAPPIIERVLAVRTDARKLNVQRPEFYYRIDYDAFAKTGTPANFVILPACAWEFDASYSLYANRSLAKSSGFDLTADLLDADGAGVTRYTVTLDAGNKLLASSDRIDAVIMAAASQAVTITPDYIYFTNNYGSTIELRWGSDPLVGSGVAGTLVANGASVVLSRQDAYLFKYTPSAGGLPDDYIAVPLGFFGSINFTFISMGTGFTSTAYTAPVTLAAGDTFAKIRQRIRLVEIPSSTSASFTIRVMGKRVVPSFQDDLDQPAMNGLVQPLLALGQAEMLERERQYTKAQAKKQEGMLLLQELIAVETVQQSHETQIIPESGYGDDYFGGAPRWGFSF